MDPRIVFGGAVIVSLLAVSGGAAAMGALAGLEASTSVPALAAAIATGAGIVVMGEIGEVPADELENA